jgi:ribonuclease-3
MLPMLRGLRAATELEKKLDYKFRDLRWLETALTHRSFSYERTAGAHYERLEFLGDAVLGLIAAEWLFKKFPERPEGELSRLKSHLVSARTLGHEAEAVGLGDQLRLGVGEERSGGRKKASLLTDSLEAVFGALYLDGGLRAARDWIEPMLERALQGVDAEFGDAKTALQEQLQARALPLPDYRVAAEEGPDHQKVFTVDCWIDGALGGTGVGETKKLAEQRAAAQALASLQSD